RGRRGRRRPVDLPPQRERADDRPREPEGREDEEGHQDRADGARVGDAEQVADPADEPLELFPDPVGEAAGDGTELLAGLDPVDRLAEGGAVLQQRRRDDHAIPRARRASRSTPSRRARQSWYQTVATTAWNAVATPVKSAAKPILAQS